MDSNRDICAKSSNHCLSGHCGLYGNADRIVAIVINFLKAFNLVQYDQLLMKILISGVVSRVVAWVREFLLGRMQSQSRRGIIRGS